MIRRLIVWAAVVWVVLYHPQAVALVGLAAVTLWGVYRANMRLQAARIGRQVHEAGLRERCDQQVAWQLEGDPRGTWGAYPPS
jgi:hypothetical protein